MADEINVRRERIEQLLQQLRYEIERGMLEREIGEDMGFRFFVPISNSIPDGVVFCEFRSPHDQQSSLQCRAEANCREGPITEQPAHEAGRCQ